jgi:hypothetical protein
MLQSGCNPAGAGHTLHVVKLDLDEQHAVAKALAVLRPDHPARVAAQRGADPVALIQLVEREDLVDALETIWLAAYRKRLALNQVR